MNPQAKTVAILSARPGEAKALEALLLGLANQSRAEPGNLRWDVWVDPTVAGRFVLDELYLDQEALEAHRSSDHFQHYRSVVADLAEREAYTVHPLYVELD